MGLDDKKLRPASAKRFDRKSKLIAVIGAAVCTAAVGAGAAGYLYYDAYYSSGWHTHAEGTYYIQPENGERAKGMQLINNTSYLFDDEGVMLTGWQEYEGEKYYLDSSGVLQKGRIKIDGEEFYFADDSGIFRTGLRDFNGAEYFFDDHGFPGNGLSEQEGKTYYFDPEGKKITGWAKKDDVQYYFKSDGEMATGFLEIDGTTYCFANDGHMLTGKQHINGRDYTFSDKGVLFRGWGEEDGHYRYADETTGAYVTGFAEIEGNTYYFDGDYNMVTGKQEIGGKYYLFGDDGVMFRGWTLEDGKKMYYGDDGAAAVGLVLIENNYYNFNKKGILQTDWYFDEKNDKAYYYGKDGVVGEGFVEYEDNVYYLDPITHEAFRGWLNVYDYPEESREQQEKFAKDMKLLLKYYKALSDGEDKLTDEELQKVWSLESDYGSGYGLLARNAAVDIGLDMTKQQYFHDDYKMATGFTIINDYIFYFDPLTGIKATGWREIEGKKYYFGFAGIAITGDTYIDGQYYSFGRDGALNSGLVNDGSKLRWGLSDGFRYDIWETNSFEEDSEGNKYYFGEDGYAVKGKKEIDGKIYIFDSDYKMLTDGLTEYKDDLYYLTKKGAVTKKWVSTDEDTTYYFGEDGKAVKGWQNLKGVDYYFDEEYHMAKDWQEIDGKKYYFQNGGLVRGPLYIEEKPYVFSEDGSMQKGWIEWNNERFYCEEEGIPLTDTEKEIDGKNYMFGAYGVSYEVPKAEE
ncbi:MAG: cell wall-binding protein [Ruminococcus sp.]|nr:cell wall-binding protein [Ruminococcus sp.]